MTAAVFVDTNVLVYARDAGEPAKQPVAANWIERLWIEQTGRTSIQVLNEYYVTVTRKLRPGMSPDEAWSDVHALLAWDPQPVDRDVVLRARDIERRNDLSWWDAMIVAAAQVQGCILLLTEDLHDGWHCDGVTVCNPFTNSVAEDLARYTTAPAPKSRHRPRGRPRREIAGQGR
jgi:predicted nucleic acid-binding protein